MKVTEGEDEEVEAQVQCGVIGEYSHEEDSTVVVGLGDGKT